MKRSKPKKYSKKDIPRLKRKLWPLFTAFIKKRDKGLCISCGTRCEANNAHCGHFIPKSICGKHLEFDERNNNLQCARCNVWLSGNGSMYAIGMIKKYGKDILEQLNKERIAHKGEQWEVKELEELIKKYQ